MTGRSGLSLWIEKLYPWIGSATLAITGVAFSFDMFQIDSSLPITSNTITISSIFIGFMGALAGIILSSDSGPVKFMKSIGKLRAILKYILEAIISSFVLLSFSLIYQLFPKLAAIPLLTSALWLFVCGLAILMTFRATHVTVYLLLSVADDNKS